MNRHAKKALAVIATIAAAVFSTQASATLTEAVCGSTVTNIVRTDNAGLAFSNTIFTTHPGAARAFSIATGTSRCVRVLFTVEASTNDFCYVRALLDGFAMSPVDDFRAIISRDISANGHAYEWMGRQRVGSGTHTVQIQRRVNNSAVTCVFDDWTFDIQLLG